MDGTTFWWVAGALVVGYLLGRMRGAGGERNVPPAITLDDLGPDAIAKVDEALARAAAGKGSPLRLPCNRSVRAIIRHSEGSTTASTAST